MYPSAPLKFRNLTFVMVCSTFIPPNRTAHCWCSYRFENTVQLYPTVKKKKKKESPPITHMTLYFYRNAIKKKGQRLARRITLLCTYSPSEIHYRPSLIRRNGLIGPRYLVACAVHTQGENLSPLRVLGGENLPRGKCEGLFPRVFFLAWLDPCNAAGCYATCSLCVRKREMEGNRERERARWGCHGP